MRKKKKQELSRKSVFEMHSCILMHSFIPTWRKKNQKEKKLIASSALPPSLSVLLTLFLLLLFAMTRFLMMSHRRQGLFILFQNKPLLL